MATTTLNVTAERLYAAWKLGHLPDPEALRLLRQQPAERLRAFVANASGNIFAAFETAAERILSRENFSGHERPRSRSDLMIWLGGKEDGEFGDGTPCMVDRDNQRLPDDAPVAAGDIADLLDVPEQTTCWFNHAGCVPARDVVREALLSIERCE